MAQHATHGGSLTQALPPEVLTEVLAALPDIPSLVSAALTCRTLYDLATDVYLDIPRRVVSNEIAPWVIMEAYTAVDARHREGWLLSWLPNKRPLTCADLLQGTASFPQRWGFNTSAAMSRLQSKIRDLSRRFAQAALAVPPIGLSTVPLSDVEWCRIERAFCRVETYCALYEIQPVNYHWQRNLANNFFRRYATWENEQFACVWDWLEDQAFKGIEKLALSDVCWANYICYDACVANTGQCEFFVHQGINVMHSLIHMAKGAPLPNDLFRIDPRKAYSSFKVRSIFQDLSLVEEDLSPGIQYEIHPTYKTLIQRPLVPDPDSGPEDAWCWSHPQLDRAPYVFCRGHYQLRQRGYVLWDRARISALVERSNRLHHETEERYIEKRQQAMIDRMQQFINSPTEQQEVPLVDNWDEVMELLNTRAEEVEAKSLGWV